MQCAGETSQTRYILQDLVHLTGLRYCIAMQVRASLLHSIYLKKNSYIYLEIRLSVNKTDNYDHSKNERIRTSHSEIAKI